LICKGFRVFHCDENRSVFRGKNAFLPISPTFSLLPNPQCLDFTGFEGSFFSYFFPYFAG